MSPNESEYKQHIVAMAASAYIRDLMYIPANLSRMTVTAESCYVKLCMKPTERKSALRFRVKNTYDVSGLDKKLHICTHIITLSSNYGQHHKLREKTFSKQPENRNEEKSLIENFGKLILLQQLLNMSKIMSILTRNGVIIRLMRITSLSITRRS